MGRDEKMPRHVAIIMDGNGRWAERHGLKRVDGHRRGAGRVFELMETVAELGIEYLTLYAFSTENWKRSPLEVQALMELLEESLNAKLPLMMEKNVRLKTIGRTEDLWPGVRAALLNAVKVTADNTGGTLVLALNYGGRAEIVDAAGRIARAVARGELKPESIDEPCFRRFLYDPELPDPDLMIRTSGELRLSNFLLWQLSYAELYATDILWPDFDGTALKEAVAAFGRRERRFGGRKK